MIKVLGLALYGPLAASTRYRLGQYAPVFAEKGIDLKIVSLLSDEYLLQRYSGGSLPLMSMLQAGLNRFIDLSNKSEYDLAIVHCELFPLMPAWLERHLIHRPYVYDFDDAFYLKYRQGKLSALQPLLNNKFDKVLFGAAAVAAGSTVLSNYAKKFNANTHYLPTVVDTARYVPRTLQHKEDGLTVGWIGSPSTAVYLQGISTALSMFGDQSPLHFRVVGGKAPEIPHVNVVEVDWEERTEVDVINSFDVGLMPLPDEPWAHGKCGFKLIQYMACGLPVVASPVGANKEIVEHGVNGFLASTSKEWVQALETLQNDPELRKRMGAAGRRNVEEKYCLQVTAPRYVELLKSVLESS